MKKQEKEDLTDWKNISSGHISNFKETAETIFAPVYKVLARQVIHDYKISEGVCVDIGSGTGGFACEIAKISDMTVYALDIRNEMVELMKGKIKEENLTGRVIPKIGDVHALPFDCGFADLIVSRGSFHFWSDKRKAFSEIYRVLKRGGIGFVGGGFGRDEDVRKKAVKLHEEAFRNMNSGRGFDETLKIRYDELHAILRNLPDFKIIFDESGLWVEIRKQ